MTLRVEVARALMENDRPDEYDPAWSYAIPADAAIAVVRDRLTAEINEYPGTEYRRHLIMVRDELLSTDKGDEG